MLELFNKLKEMKFEQAIEYCCEYEGDCKIDIDYNTKAIIISKGNVCIKNDYDWSDNYLKAYSNEEIEGTVKVAID